MAAVTASAGPSAAGIWPCALCSGYVHGARGQLVALHTRSGSGETVAEYHRLPSFLLPTGPDRSGRQPAPNRNDAMLQRPSTFAFIAATMISAQGPLWCRCPPAHVLVTGLCTWKMRVPRVPAVVMPNKDCSIFKSFGSGGDALVNTLYSCQRPLRWPNAWPHSA
jgi:hypothetical protein